MSSFTIFGCSIIHPSRPSSLRAVELGLEHTLVNFLPSQVLASHVADALYWHTDYGTVTLLHQDSVGGLEVQDPNCEHLCTTAEREGVETDDLGRLSAGIYHSATPIPGTIVVNVGDLLCTSSLLTLLLSFCPAYYCHFLSARWSNNVLRSTLHRVVAPPVREIAKSDGSGETVLATPARQSMAFFSNPNQGTVIECLPTCQSEGNEAKYEPVTTNECKSGLSNFVLWANLC